jgi:MFS family permease
MALPALSSRAAAAVAGALLFGGTFMGIVTATMALARRLDPRPGGGSIGTMAALYGAGQVVGPLLAGLLSRATGGPRLPVLMASAAVGAGALLLSTRSDEAAA